MKTFEKNVETSKKFYQAFSDKKLDEMKSFVAENYTWSPPPTGIDSLDVNTWYNSMQGFNDTYDNIEFTNQLYFAGLDENQKPNGDVRVYGTWKSLNSTTEKPVLMDYYAVLFFNEEGKIHHQSEWYNTADLNQNALVDAVAIIPLTKGYSRWYKGFIKDNKNRERFCDDSKTLVHRDVNDPNKVSVYLFDVDLSKLGEMMSDPAFEDFAISLGEDLANKKVYTINPL
jgi:ketosteroid isomerase-like protein